MKTTDRLPPSPLGDGVKRAMLVAVGILMMVGAIIALVHHDLVWTGVFGVPAAIVFYIAVWGKSAAVKKAANLVEHSAFTLHVPSRSSKPPKSVGHEKTSVRKNTSDLDN